MKHSNTELIVERYYRLKKWLVEKDVPILPQTGNKHWGDLDILAVGEEVHLISCKDFLPSNKDIHRVIKNLVDAEFYIKNEYKHLNNKLFSKLYVYGGTGKEALQVVRQHGIITLEIKELFAKYIKMLDDYLSKMNIGRKDTPRANGITLLGNSKV